MAAAQAAAKRLRDDLNKGFGDPFKDMPSELPLPRLPRDAPSKLPKEGEEAAGAFARGFKNRLETAFKALPKVKLGADATEAQTKVQDLRARLAELSGKTIGVDIDAATALAEMAAIKRELQTIDTSADVDLRADASVAIAQIAALQHAVDLLNTNAAERELANLQARLAELGSREIGVDLDAGAAKTELGELQRGLERLNRTSADPRIRVDTMAAIAQVTALQAEIDGLNTERPEQKLAGLRSRLAELQARRIGVDIDAGAAKAELASIQGELRRLNASTPNVQVRVDSTAALAEIAAMQAGTDRLDGRTANVSVFANVAPALAALGMVSAALAAIPAAATVAVGVGALGAAFTSAGVAAGGFAAVAIPSLGRVNEALQQQESAAGGAGGATESLAAKQAKAAATALQLAEAQDRVKAAQQGVRDALSGVGRAQEDAARAAEQAAERQASAARRVEAAERSVQDAHRATQRAIEDLTRARERAQQRIEDLALATEGGALAEERARIALARAQSEAARTEANRGSSVLERQDASLRVREAEFALKEVQARNSRLAKESADAAAKGVEGSDEVRAAKEAIEAATRREQEAERSLAEARRQAAREAIDGQRAIAAAHERVAEAQRKVTQAQHDLLRAQQRLRLEQLQAKAAMDKTGSSAGSAATKMAELTKEEAKLAQEIKDFKKVYEDWQKSLQKPVFGVISKSLDLIEASLPRLTPLVLGASEGFSTLLDDLTSAITSPYWQQWFDDMGREAPRAIEGLGRSAGNVVSGLGGIAHAFLPFSRDFLDWLVEVTGKFSDWGRDLENSPGFKKFIAYVQENAPKVGQLLADIGVTAGNIVSALSGAGSGALDFLAGIAEKLRGMSPEQIQAVAVGVGGIVAAAKLGTTLKLGGFLLLANVLSEMSPGQIQRVATAIAAVVLAVKGYQAVKGVSDWWSGLGGSINKAGNEASTSKGKFSGLKDVMGGPGMVAAAGGFAVVLGNIDRELSGLNPNIDTLTRHLNDFTRGGKPAADVLDQMQGKASMLHAIPGIPVLNDMKELGDVVQQMSSEHWWDKAATGVGGFLNSIGGEFGVTLDHGAERLSNMDQSLAGMVRSGNLSGAALLFDQLTKEAREAGTPVDRLKDLFPQYTAAVDNSVDPTQDAAQAFQDARVELDGLSTSMNAFTGRTDFAQAVETLKGKYDDLVKALRDSNGNLDISKAKTDAQRDAVIQAREKFSGLIQGVRDLADRQKDLGGSTDDVKGAVLDQVGALLKLAGRSKEAKDLVYDLARNFGITKTEADKAKGGVKDVKEALDKLKNKTVHVDADTSKAENAIKTLISKYNGYKIVTRVDAKTGRSITTYEKQADGGVLRYYADGGIARFAAGVEKHVAQIAPAGAMRIWAEPETGGEAYIPLASSKRARSLQILEAVAAEFGRQVIPTTGGGATSSRASVATSSSSGGGSGVVTVSLDNLPELADATGYTARVVGGAMSQAASATTQAADQLAGTAESAIEGLGSRIDSLGSAIDRLASSVDGLASAVGSAARSAGSSSTTGSSGSGGKTSSTSKTGSSAPSLATAAAREAAKQAVLQKTGLASAVKKAKAAGSGSGDPWANAVTVTPAPMADGGLVRSPLILAGEAGAEMVIPLSASRRGRGLQTLAQAAALMGQTITPAQPQYVPGGVAFGGVGQAEIQALRQSITQLAQRVEEGNSSPNINVTNHYPQAEPTSRTVARALQLAAIQGSV